MIYGINMKNIENKLYKDGMTAILVSSGYGAGWSTWMPSYPECVFDPVLAQMVIDDVDYQQMLEYCEMRYPDAYYGGLEDIEIQWLKPGTLFRINEYDGSESVEVLDEVNWMMA